MAGVVDPLGPKNLGDAEALPL